MRPRVNQSAVLLRYPGPTGNITICCSLNFSNSDSFIHLKTSAGLVDHVQYSLRVYNVQHSFKVEPHLFLNDLSSSFGQHISIQFHLRGGQFVHWDNTTLCHNKSTPDVTIVKLPSDVGCKTIGEITSIAKNEQPWLTK